MKCPKCGYNNPPSGTQDGKCDECGYLLFPIDSSNTGHSELASLVKRFFAQLIDSFICIAICILSIIILPESVVRIGIYLALFYLLFSDAIKGGQSFGKQVMQISVVDATSKRPCTLIKSLIRNLPLAFLGIIDWVFIFSRTRQRLGDRLANTIVIEKK
ncbi:RDD family protein [Brasilonema sp. UFV-L1]|uniref:RDD family protein n=1 Tax=Brasilonema sp. UFV-L1 TaxID=2234130 RepID=UPI00145E2DB7|nr:RDD family protein [Brasilonema sp. UFV-L1]